MEAQQAILKSTIKAQHSIQLTLSVSTGVEVSHKTCICFICFVSLSESSFFSPTFTNLLKDTSKDGLPQWLHGKESFCNAGAACLIPGSRRSPGGQGYCYPLSKFHIYVLVYCKDQSYGLCGRGRGWGDFREWH